MDRVAVEKNRTAWNEASTYHQKARNNSLQEGFKNPDFSAFDRDCDAVLIEKLNEIKLKGKTVAQLPCNNGRELLSLVKMGAKKGVGFDISDIVISEAKELAAISKLNVDFYRTNILDIDDAFNSSIDFIYISEGSLQWFSSLTDYFKVISKLLKPAGKALIYEIHPFAYFFEPSNDSGEKPTLDNFLSYFENGPYSYKNGMDYVGQTNYQAKECCWYMHKFSDIVNALICNGLEIEKIDEYNMEMANNEGIKNMEKFPLSYIMIIKKKHDAKTFKM
jgi:SAM-dependent methyltransferase